LGRYWLFFDWVSPESDIYNPDIYVMTSKDGRDWNDPIQIVYTESPENGVKTLFHDNIFYITYLQPYNEGEENPFSSAIYLRTSEDGLEANEQSVLYAPDDFVRIDTHDLIFADEWFYLVYSDVEAGDIFLVRSRDLSEWTTPVAVTTDSNDPDYSPDLCVARGKLWLAWSSKRGASNSHIWITSSEDGIYWSEPIDIPPTSDYDEYWGPISLIHSRGQFSVVARASVFGYGRRIVCSTSKDGVSWGPFSPLTASAPGNVIEKGPTVFPLYRPIDGAIYRFSVVFKRLWNDGEFSSGIIQIPLSLRL
jgi:hypothetical protein